jgi:arylformamidase
MASYDTDLLERMYNNRARVPGFATHFKRWAETSEAARTALAPQLNIEYGQGRSETLDIFRARAEAPARGAPVLVFIHGGWWRSLDKSDHSFVAPSFSAQGACVVLPNYALAPASTIPEITMQMVKALAWTWRNIAQYGGDPSRITLAGHSAGGHLAAMLLACDWKAYDSQLPADVVKNALSISGLFELESIMHTPSLQASLALTYADALKASPAYLPPPQRGTLYTVVGDDESDEFLRHNALIRQAWGKKSVPVCEAEEGHNHFSIVEALAEPGSHLHSLAQQLLSST